MTPRAQVFTVAAGVVTAVAMSAVASRNLPVPPPAYDVVPVLFAGCVAVLAGVLVGRWRPGHRAAWLLVTIGMLTLLTLLMFSNRALPFTIGGLLAGAQLAVALHLMLSLPDGRLDMRVDQMLVGLVYAVTVASKVLPNLFLDCTNPFGFGCPGNLLLVRDEPEFVVWLDRFWGVVGCVVVGLVAARMAVRWWRAGPTLRRVLAAPYVASVPVLALAAAELAQVVQRFGPVAVLLAPLVLSLLPVGVLLGILRSQARSGVVGSLVTAMEPSTGSVRDRLKPLLAQALGDPSARLLTPHDASAEGARGRVRTAVTSSGRTLAVLEHDSELLSEPEVLSAVLATASLALENERLGALARAQLVEVAESRKRLVTAQVEERRRLERDLHDGAQQRLVTVRLMLAMAIEQGAGSDLVAEATALLEETTAELRDLARGVHPSVVTEHGLGGAVDALAERAAVPVELRGEVPRLTELVEVTAYFVVAEALTNVARHANATHAMVELAIDVDRLVVTVSDDGDGGADLGRGTGLAGLRDRVEAAGADLSCPRRPGAGPDSSPSFRPRSASPTSRVTRPGDERTTRGARGRRRAVAGGARPAAGRRRLRRRGRGGERRRADRPRRRIRAGRGRGRRQDAAEPHG